MTIFDSDSENDYEDGLFSSTRNLPEDTDDEEDQIKTQKEEIKLQGMVFPPVLNI